MLKYLRLILAFFISIFLKFLTYKNKYVNISP